MKTNLSGIGTEEQSTSYLNITRYTAKFELKSMSFHVPVSGLEREKSSMIIKRTMQLPLRGLVQAQRQESMIQVVLL
jgi:hypothetical protein